MRRTKAQTKTVFKVVRSVEGEPLSSAVIRGPLQLQFSGEYWTQAPSKSLPICAFENLKSAKRFLDARDEPLKAKLRIYEAQGVIVQMPSWFHGASVGNANDWRLRQALRGFSVIKGTYQKLLDCAFVARYLRSRRNQGWPEGTVFCSRLKLLSPATLSADQ